MLVCFGTLWTLWTERNNKVFTNKTLTVDAVLNLIWVRLGRLAHAKWPGRFRSPIDFSINPLSSVRKDPMLIGQKGPAIESEEGMFSCKVDGALCRHSRVGGIGGVWRDYLGNSVGAFSKHVNIGSAIGCELEAIYFALLVIKGWGKKYVKKILVESDSCMAVKMVQNECDAIEGCCEVLHIINILKGGFNEFQIRYIDRWDNEEADDLAKSGISRPSPWLLLT